IMTSPSFTLLYVDNPSARALFYAELLGREPVEASPTFALFALDTGAMLGLWSQHTVEPAATAPGGCEIGFSLSGHDKLEQLYDEWKSRGMRFAQEPVDMDFGRTFVALDPDGHRLRAFVAADG
ncbi:hypothetical protein COL154_013983, partial [Colletotrichum chrysophilum]